MNNAETRGILDYFPLPEIRPTQKQALLEVFEAFESGKKFVFLEAPPGVGKSALAVALARYYGQAYVLTKTIQLQEQYVDDFDDARELKGRGNFTCNRLKDTEGSCESGADRFKLQPCDPHGCPYRLAKAEALLADLTICNYMSYLWSVGTTMWSSAVLDENAGDESNWYRPLLILDEAHSCFPAGVRVGDRRIEEIRVGDIVPSFDGETEVRREVVATFRSVPEGLIRVVIGRRSVVCTPNHPFLTPDGWARADSLHGKDVLSIVQNENCSSSDLDVQLPRMRAGVPGLRGQEVDLQPDSKEGVPHVLQSQMSAEQTEEGDAARVRGMREGDGIHRTQSGKPSALSAHVLLRGVPEVGVATDVSCATKEAFSADDSNQPDERSRDEGVGRTEATSKRELETVSTGRERARTDGSGAVAVDGAGLADQRDRMHRSAESEGVPESLQGGCWSRGTEDRDRGRREESPLAQNAGREERRSSTWERVDRVEVLERGSDGTFGGMCPDGHVYNIEVEDTHTYVVGGFVVHNCESVMMDHVSISVELSKLKGLIPTLVLPPMPNINDGGAKACFEWLEAYLAAMRQVVPGTYSGSIEKHLVMLVRKATFALEHQKVEEWIAEPLERGAGFALKPLTVKSFAKRLFRYGKRVLLMSATVLDAEMMATDLGIDDYSYVCVPSPFPVENREVISFGLDMAFESRDRTWPAMVDIISQILDQHDEKGLILCPSNKMIEFIVEKLQPVQRVRLIVASGNNRVVDYQRHLAAPGPSVLIAPGYWEGADLKEDYSRFQIIPAIPYPMWGGQIRARAELRRDRRWYRMQAYSKLIQGAGRSVRSATDSATTYVLDKRLKKEAQSRDSLLPQWFKDSLVFA